MKVFKYRLQAGLNRVFLPQDAAIVAVAKQNNKPVMWAKVDPEKENVCRQFYAAMTGENIPDGFCLHRGTVLLDEEHFVLHVFECDEIVAGVAK